jgi:hypothetical protein
MYAETFIIKSDFQEIRIINVNSAAFFPHFKREFLTSQLIKKWLKALSYTRMTLSAQVILQCNTVVE